MTSFEKLLNSENVEIVNFKLEKSRKISLKKFSKKMTETIVYSSNYEMRY